MQIDRSHFENFGFQIVDTEIEKDYLRTCLEVLTDPSFPVGNMGLGRVELRNKYVLTALNNRCRRIVKYFYELYSKDNICLLHGLDRYSVRTSKDRPMYPHLDTKITKKALDKYASVLSYDGKYEHRIQGVLYLTDCGSGQGGTLIVPNMHRYPVFQIIREKFPRLEEQELLYKYSSIPREIYLYVVNELWKDLSLSENIFRPIVITAKAGDLLLFDQKLIHGNTRIEDDSKRVAVYVRYFLES